MFDAAYREAFRGAGRVLFAPTFHAGRLGDDEKLDFARLAADLSAQGVPAEQLSTTGEVFARALAEARPGDVLVTMSSGSFDGLPHRLAQALADQDAQRAEGSAA